MKQQKEPDSIAALIACYNRKNKTLAFLDSLVTQSFLKKVPVDIYLLDDGSTDGTAAAVRDKYPDINIVAGSGNLFWARSMRILWEHAIKQKQYHLYFLFNDDVILFDDAIKSLVGVYRRGGNDGTVLIGSTKDAKTNAISYGGYNLNKAGYPEYHSVIPDPVLPLPCQIGNANIMLVDDATVKKIGIFSDLYTHQFSDFDYTLTASKAGINVLVAPGYYGYCEFDHGANWLSANTSLKERLNYLYSPKGLSYKERLIWLKKHYKKGYASAVAKLWMKTIFPIFWDVFKRKDKV
jgi:GT2 family glycosyltransferase